MRRQERCVADCYALPRACPNSLRAPGASRCGEPLAGSCAHEHTSLGWSFFHIWAQQRTQPAQCCWPASWGWTQQAKPCTPCTPPASFRVSDGGAMDVQKMGRWASTCKRTSFLRPCLTCRRSKRCYRVVHSSLLALCRAWRALVLWDHPTVGFSERCPCSASGQWGCGAL